MSLNGASGSAAGYNFLKRLVVFVIQIISLLVSVNSMVDMLYFNGNCYHTLLVSAYTIYMMLNVIKLLNDIILLFKSSGLEMLDSLSLKPEYGL